MEIFCTKTFVIESDYTPLELQLVKVMEEAAEAFLAAKALRSAKDDDEQHQLTWYLRTELSDVIQATLNAQDKLGLIEDEVKDDMRECYRRNVIRGRVE